MKSFHDVRKKSCNHGFIKTFKLLLLFSLLSQSAAWDSEELEIFDVVEEVNENFYNLMGIPPDAPLPDVKKAYRTLSKQLHPDKNDASDAEIKFRQLVSVYEILRDDNKRARYDRVLIEGLPDWRSPIYYYRRARKMSLLESSIILTVVISITQYLMAWGSYFDRKHTMEEQLCRKYKIKDRRKRKPEDDENRNLVETELSKLPRPTWWNILPIQLVQLSIWIITNGPSFAHSCIIAWKEDMARRDEKRKEEEENERRLKEEEEKRKERKALLKSRKKVQNLPEYEGYDRPSSEQNSKPVREVSHSEPEITGGPWTDEDFSELARLMAKYPGGTADRWEKISANMNRTVFEVTKMSNKIKERLMSRVSVCETAEVAPEVTMKQKTKGGKLSLDKADSAVGSDEMWSVVQQKSLEKALKQFPKGTDQRWDKIARFVPDKTKEDCMIRFKYLAEKIRKKKEEQLKENGEEIQQDTQETCIPPLETIEECKTNLGETSQASAL